jgi:flagellar biosynthetic protein FlhB
MAKDPSKTEKATPRRRQKAREEGQVAKSQDIPISASLVAVSILLIFYIPFAFKQLYKLFIYFFSDPFHHISQNSVAVIFFVIKELAFLLFPIFLVLFIIGIASNVIQVGFLITFKALAPKLEKLNPISGILRLFSLKTLFELFKNLLKLLVAIVVSYFLVSYLLDDVFRFAKTSIYDDSYFLVKYLFIMVLAFAILSIPIGVIDFFFRKHEFEENIKMSKQEIKEEQKQYEGNPQIKAAIRKKMREMSLTRMMAEVAKADVVITNPEHYAVALKYEREGMRAPKVIAKGADNVALKIKEEAKKHGVVIEENPPLARSLYSSCEIGDYIPQDLYQVVAKIFAKVYKKKGMV